MMSGEAALIALLTSAATAIERGIPETFLHEGRTYHLCVPYIKGLLEIYAKSSDSTPRFASVFDTKSPMGHQPPPLNTAPQRRQ